MAERLAVGLEDMGSVESVVWTQGVFDVGTHVLDGLIKQARTVDYAILILSPDDDVQSRDILSQAPRDNVIFELGLFIGTLGKDRTYMVQPNGVSMKLPTDLAGITQARYNATRSDGNLQSALRPAVISISDQIRQSGPRSSGNDVAATAGLETASSATAEESFFMSSLEDPSVSDARKDLLAEVWRDLSVSRNEEVPDAAKLQLSHARMRARGKVVGPDIVKKHANRVYSVDVKDAIARVKPEDSKVDSPRVYAGKIVDGLSTSSDLTLIAGHGHTELGIFIQPTWDAHVSGQLSRLKEILVIAPDAPTDFGVSAVRWSGEEDDLLLADALERHGLFDRLPDTV